MTIKQLAEDWWECTCGNRPDSDGFYPCTKDGELVEPTPKDWDDYYLCYLCGDIVHYETFEIAGRAAPEIMKKNEEFFKR